ncbi:MAG: UDP-2,4-diacetamido-2,4,6-trideoxy-beta-L-altropyranose hydrolase [Lachnospiraceae bacterium]|nr:UDP-2,4-diacetamido-2,4,6-trideoxy-beta-L-altropyranose hydrolase [Lachnospiraceae bacterium]
MSEECLFIRADMNSEISTGHVMRCLSIADAAARMGKKAAFITADDSPKELIESRGHRCIVLGTNWNDLQGELPALEKVIASEKADRLLVDHYSVTEEYLKRLNGLTQVYYLDDLKAFDYPVSAVICYAVYGEDYYTDKDHKKKYFLGCEYAPLREAFEHPHPKMINDRIGNILIMTGGSDPYGIAEGVLGSLALDEYVSVNVICGRYSGMKERLTELFGDRENVHIYPFVENVWELYDEADVAISAGGSTLYELASMGVPVITYSFADNQIPNVSSFDKKGLMPCAGDARKDDIHAGIIKHLDEMRPPEVRKCISGRLMKLVDGKGAERLAHALLDIGK